MIRAGRTRRRRRRPGIPVRRRRRWLEQLRAAAAVPAPAAHVGSALCGCDDCQAIFPLPWEDTIQAHLQLLADEREALAALLTWGGDIKAYRTLPSPPAGPQNGSYESRESDS